MRCLVLAVSLALAASFVINCCQYGRKSELQSECARLEKELETMRRGQAASEAALSAAAEGRAEAARNAREQYNDLDALEEDADDLPDIEFLERLRRVCVQNGNNSVDAAGGAHARVPRTAAAQRNYDGRE